MNKLRLEILALATTLLLVLGCGASDPQPVSEDQPTQDTGCIDCDGADLTAEVTAEQDTGTDCSTVCVGLECGDFDGCPCGTCQASQMCNNGLCEAPQPDCDTICADLQCDDKDGCTCGQCAMGETCEANLCQPCIADCGGKQCGPDGCAGSCGNCDTGQCHPDTGNCVDCFPPGQEPTFSDVAHKVNHLEIADGGLPGYALDVDQDPETCAPAGNCQGGLDNALGGLLGQVGQFVDVNAELAKALDEGAVTLLMESVNPSLDGEQFTINMYLGQAVADKETCDWQSQTCDYFVSRASFDLDTCTPIIFFDNATITDGHLSAGGPDAVFSVAIPLDAGLVLTANAYLARIEATAVVDGANIIGLQDGIVGGAVNKQELIDTCLALPADTFYDMPVSKEMICNLLDMFITTDIDSDDDGLLDSASVGIAFSAITATILGLTPDA